MLSEQKINIIWFKRDLRIHDNQCLSTAAKKYPILPLYIYEPNYWQLPDTSGRQWEFIAKSLLELNDSLQHLGQSLIIETGTATEVFNKLAKQFSINKIYSHQETGNDWTYQRDTAVQQWCNAHDIQWVQFLQFAVVRGYLNRDSWAKFWNSVMKRSLIKAPKCLEKIIDGNIESITQIKGPIDTTIQKKQLPGRRAAVNCLRTFLYERGQSYQSEMSSPNTAANSCSRLSTHIAYGTISMVEVFHSLNKRRNALYDLPTHIRPKYWLRSLNAFESRLHWHCHFIQKLESEPRIEYENLLSHATGLRENEFNEHYFVAWKTGNTGFPFVDACMRSLIATGWINFRMRAMLVSFACYQLWLHWVPVAHYLASLFTDYEPGIHYSQVQMQAGTTGINTIRIYNPIKQSIDQDKKGDFIRKWVPELAKLSNEDIHQPFEAPPLMLQEVNITIGINYPNPIVDNKSTTKYAKDKVYALKRQSATKQQAKKIYKKHGSRKKLTH
jgi:deoxyribodipyrimidine photo-lyase